MKVTVSIDDARLSNVINSLFDDATMLKIYRAFAERCDPYVPYDTGALSESGLTHITPQGITYTMPYASKQYYGTDIHHNQTHHPKATAYWDKAMMNEQGDAFVKDVEQIIAEKARESGG